MRRLLSLLVSAAISVAPVFAGMVTDSLTLQKGSNTSVLTEQMVATLGGTAPTNQLIPAFAATPTNGSPANQIATVAWVAQQSPNLSAYVTQGQASVTFGTVQANVLSSVPAVTMNVPGYTGEVYFVSSTNAYETFGPFNQYAYGFYYSNGTYNSNTKYIQLTNSLTTNGPLVIYAAGAMAPYIWKVGTSLGDLGGWSDGAGATPAGSYTPGGSSVGSFTMVATNNAITNNGPLFLSNTVLPAASNAFDLGSSALPMRNGYFNGLYGNGAGLTNLNVSGLTNGTSNLSISNLTLYGNLAMSNTVWDDVTVPLVFSTSAGTYKAPAWARVTTITGEIYMLQFQYQATVGNEQEAMFSVQLPHRYKRGTDLHPHVHWIPSDTNVGNVVWGLEFVSGPLTGGFPVVSETYKMTNSTVGSVSNRMIISEWVQTIPGSNLVESSCIFGRIFRNSSSAGDTYTGRSAIGVSFDMHFEIDKLGSDNELP